MASGFVCRKCLAQSTASRRCLGRSQWLPKATYWTGQATPRVQDEADPADSTTHPAPDDRIGDDTGYTFNIPDFDASQLSVPSLGNTGPGRYSNSHRNSSHGRKTTAAEQEIAKGYNGRCSKSSFSPSANSNAFGPGSTSIQDRLLKVTFEGRGGRERGLQTRTPRYRQVGNDGAADTHNIDFESGVNAASTRPDKEDGAPAPSNADLRPGGISMTVSTKDMSRDEVSQDHAIEELDGALQQGIPAMDAWEVFTKHFARDCRALTQTSLKGRVILSKHRPFWRLLHKITIEWADCKDPKWLVSPLEAGVRASKVGVMKQGIWLEMIWILLCKLQMPAASGTVNYEDVDSRIPRELLQLWKAFLRDTGSSWSSEDRNVQPENGWDFLPKVGSLEGQRGGHVPAFPFKLGEQFKSIPIRMRNHTACAALASFDVFSSYFQTGSGDIRKEEYMPFLIFLSQILVESNTWKTFLDLRGEFMRRQVPYIDESFKQRLSKSSARAVDILKAEGIAIDLGEGLSEARRPREEQERFRKRINAASSAKDFRYLDQIWQEVQEGYLTEEQENNGNEGPEKPKRQIPVALYNLIIQAYMDLGLLNRATEIWNQMLSRGGVPNLMLFTSMMTVANRARQPKALEQLWERMTASGVLPDSNAWAARISGHMAQRPEDGLLVLSDMGHSWAAAARNDLGLHSRKKFDPSTVNKDFPGLPKPNTAVLNAALAVLIRKKQRGRVQGVLSWARAYGIKPDAYTINMLIRHSLQHENTEEAVRLFETMLSSGIAPDLTTFTTIIDALFRRTDNTAEQAGQLVRTVVRHLDSLPQIDFACASIIEGLLKNHNNRTGAELVLRYMRERGVPMSPHINTILITSFFEQRPPDIAAVNALWHDIQIGRAGGAGQRGAKARVDSVFYDRLVKGYAECDELDRMMMALAEMEREGMRSSWPVLLQVAMALARARDWRRVEVLARDVEAGEGIARHGIKSFWNSTGERDFWELVAVARQRMEEVGSGKDGR
ncbi:hypothetical protein BDY21DRAFT_330026 [Lineolata rhizophorae]|uniref:Pentatricopeptide repeat protein n=1 Tax=Lineolata rhizophorae TaxID=578093 RepID=A0A6A6PDA1_9PEZI|nr:hypothetical protein BDY21DRAFT_330026 [Lineolata rhizophorae]